MKYLALMFAATPFLVFSQKLENLQAVPAGDKILITYDLSATNPGDKFDVALFGSHNNFSSPIQRVTGDVGKGLGVGKGKQIEWDAKNEIGTYRGNLTFEIHAEVIAAFALRHEVISVKRGKSINLDWQGGSKNQDVKIELVKPGGSSEVVGTSANKGSYQWAVPARQKTGSGYQLRLVNGKETILTTPFTIKHKIPTLVKVIPFAVIGAVIALTGGSKSSPSNTSLPMPPDLGLTN
ncbi:MAG: Ser-Thr-rich GPI-anchored membrane family protein [Cytophagales bacterium]|nr:Ser-Thr-rich GPI-anchored membrane family protein [Cytophagales bacterium]